MRALFTQLSLLVGFITVFNMNAANYSLVLAIATGLLVAYSIYAVLLLGDITIHRVLEEKVGTLTSVRFIDDAFDSDWLNEPTSETDLTKPTKEAIAA